MTGFMLESGIDFAFWVVSFIITFLIIDIILIRLLKPSKQIMKLALGSGFLLALSVFVLEVYMGIIGLWGYISDYTVLGIPITVPIFFSIIGFGAPIFYNKATAYLERKVSMPYAETVLFLIMICIMTTLSTFGDILVSDFGWSPDNWNYILTFSHGMACGAVT